MRWVDDGLCHQSPVFLRTSAAPQAWFDGESVGQSGVVMVPKNELTSQALFEMVSIAAPFGKDG